MRIQVAVIAATVLLAGFMSTPAEARIFCGQCVPAYERCVESGATNCDTQYATCLRWCPVPLYSSQPLDLQSKRKEEMTPVAADPQFTLDLSALAKG